MDEKILRKNLADNIRMLRTKHRFSQDTLAELANATQQQISFLENERLLNPKLLMITKIAEVFNVTVNDLIYENK